MFALLIPENTRGRIARKIVLDCLAQIPNEIVCKAKCRGLMTAGHLSGRFCGFEVTVGAELIQQQLQQLINELELDDPRLPHGVLMMQAVGGGPCAVRLHQYLTASCEVSRIRAAKELSDSPEPRAWSSKLIRRLLGAERSGPIKNDLAHLICEIAKCSREEPFDVEGAVELLEDEFEPIRIYVLEVLCQSDKLRDAMVLKLAAQFFRDQSPAVRCRIVERLGQSAKSAEICMPVLMSALECEDGTAIAAMTALGRFGAQASAALPRLTLELLCGHLARAIVARSAIVAIQGEVSVGSHDSGSISILVVNGAAKAERFNSAGSTIANLVRMLVQPTTAG
jgi:hypothetical protein